MQHDDMDRLPPLPILQHVMSRHPCLFLTCLALPCLVSPFSGSCLLSCFVLFCLCLVSLTNAFFARHILKRDLFVVSRPLFTNIHNLSHSRRWRRDALWTDDGTLLQTNADTPETSCNETERETWIDITRRNVEQTENGMMD